MHDYGVYAWKKGKQRMPNEEKHKKKITEPLSISDLIQNLPTLIKSITALGNKQQHLINDWFRVWSIYLDFENKFDPKRLIYYKRGDVIHAHFGYNVGNEFGGVHYAVVVENNNNITNGLVTVVPISSLEEGKTKDDLHKTEVYLGKIIGDVECFAMPMQIRSISKLRIIRPKRKSDNITALNNDCLDKIDDQIRYTFTKQKINT